MVAGVSVSGEDGGADGRPDVPQDGGFISRGRQQEVGGGQEVDAVDGGLVASKRLATPLAGQVPEFGGSVGGTGGQEVSGGVEGAAPGGLRMTEESQKAAAQR